MQLSTQFGFAFLCMPKCASTSIESVLSEYCNVNFSGHPGLKHINAEKFKTHILSYHSHIIPAVKIDIFCLMRDPIEWTISWYRFRSRKALINPNHPNHINYTGRITFEEFVNGVMSKDPPSYAKIGTQSDFFRLANGKIGVDFIFPLERLDLVADYISKKISKPISIPLWNASPSPNIELSEKLHVSLKEHFKDDYKIYNSLPNLKAKIY